MSSTSGTLPPASSGASCPGPMTRAALLALRTAGTLSTSCHYVITDHVQGRLVAGTTITLHAVAGNELSQAAQVNTTYDNEAWVGIYDLDAGSVIYLRDNRGNEVDGASQVGQFDWGNASYSYVRVLGGAVLAADIGNAAVKQRVTVDGASVLNLTGFTGTIQDCQITELAQVGLAGTSLLFASMEVTDSTQVFANTLTAAGGSVQRGVWRNASVTLSGTGVPTIYDTDIETATVTHNSPSGLTWANCEFASGAVVTHTGAGAQSLTRVTVRSGSQIQHTGAGPLTGLNSDVFGRAYWSHASTGVMSITEHVTSGGAACRVETTGDGNVTLLRGVVESGGVVRCNTGSITLTSYDVRGTVEHLPPAAATAATTITAGAVEALAKITNTGAGVTTGTRLYVKGLWANNSSVSLVSNNGGTLTLTDVHLDSGFIATTTATVNALRVRCETNGYVDSKGLGAFNLTDTTLHQNGKLQSQAGALADATMVNTTVGFAANVFIRAGSAGSMFFEDAILQRGLIDKRATSTTGVFRFGQISSGATTTTLDGGTINIIGNASLYQIIGGFYGRYSTVNLGGTRDVRHVSCDIKNTTTINHTGTGGVAGTVLDQMLDCTLERTTVNFASSGAAINSLEALNAVSNSTFNINGTTASQRWVRFKMGAFSTCTFTDCTAAVIHTNTTVLDSSAVTFTNVAVAKWIEDCQVVSGSVLTVAAPTVAGLVNRLTIQSRGTVTVTGPVGTVSRSTAMAGGILNFTGGAAHANVTASMSGALTMPFDTGNVYHNTNVNTTTTVANTNRGRDFFNNNIV